MELEAIKRELEEMRARLDEMFQKVEGISKIKMSKEALLFQEGTHVLTKFDIQKLPEAEAVRLVVPLAHIDRVKILKALVESGKYFTELLEKTGLSHSPLYFHLNILQKANYVKQEYARGRYLVTPLGVKALEFLVLLHRFSEEGEK